MEDREPLLQINGSNGSNDTVPSHSVVTVTTIDSSTQVVQCVAECCSELQGVAVCCSVMQRDAVSCSVLRVLQCVAVCCSVLQCVAVCCSVLQRIKCPHSRDYYRLIHSGKCPVSYEESPVFQKKSPVS